MDLVFLFTSSQVGWNRTLTDIFHLSISVFSSRNSFLQVLKHPHIVSLHGVTAGSVESNLASGKECGFFIVVDQLEETLEAKLDHWRIEHEKNSAPRMAWMSSDYKAKKRTELMERIKIAMEIADAMHYLHSLGIVFRDLKPDNMGFDENGVLKIFDFGLAKELKKCLELDNGKYDMTGNTGRYVVDQTISNCIFSSDRKTWNSLFDF